MKKKIMNIVCWGIIIISLTTIGILIGLRISENANVKKYILRNEERFVNYNVMNEYGIDACKTLALLDKEWIEAGHGGIGTYEFGYYWTEDVLQLYAVSDDGSMWTIRPAYE